METCSIEKKQYVVSKHIKRIMDIFLSIIAIILLLPLLICVSFLVLINLGKPIFFVQERVGKDNKIFNLIKFRTMKNSKTVNGELLEDKDRLTAFGRIVRSLSIDELPELLNIIKGDMSIVGPRPLLVDYLNYYNSEQIKRHTVYPGLTGWAQINGRNLISWHEKFDLDLWYVNNWSLWLDLKIIFLTIKTVIKKEGINHDDSVTMEYFNGSN